MAPKFDYTAHKLILVRIYTCGMLHNHYNHTLVLNYRAKANRLHFESIGEGNLALHIDAPKSLVLEQIGQYTIKANDGALSATGVCFPDGVIQMVHKMKTDLSTEIQKRIGWLQVMQDAIHSL